MLSFGNDPQHARSSDPFCLVQIALRGAEMVIFCRGAREKKGGYNRAKPTSFSRGSRAATVIFTSLDGKQKVLSIDMSIPGKKPLLKEKRGETREERAALRKTVRPHHRTNPDIQKPYRYVISDVRLFGGKRGEGVFDAALRRCLPGFVNFFPIVPCACLFLCLLLLLH